MVNRLLNFIRKSPTAFHAVEEIRLLLEGKNYIDADKNKIELGKNYYRIRNESSIIAFSIPEKIGNKFNLISSHSDSPYYKLKQNPNLNKKNYTVLNVSAYGGMIHSSFIDRPLNIAGRVVYEDHGNLKSKLINFDRPMAIIPNLAIHLNRDANNGYIYKLGKDILPMFSNENKDLLKLIMDEFDIKNILSHDLYVTNHQKGYTWGNNDEFISSPRLDNLECAFSSIIALLESDVKQISLCAVFDNEEVGNSSYMGASSDFLLSTINLITNHLNISSINLVNMLNNSIAISADNAHAIHPNHIEKYDETNFSKINNGPVVKFSNNQRYTTDSISAGYFMNMCKKNNIPYQIFENHSAIPGGSTLGNALHTHISMRSLDIGLPQLAMHSSLETAGSYDLMYLINIMKAYYSNI